MKSFPELRLSVRVDVPPREDGSFVLYWMTAARRTRFSFALDRAIDWARELDRPLVVLEGVRAGYRWASDRHHRTILDGMRDQRAAFEGAGVRYLPYVEPEDGAGKGLLEALAEHAAVVVTDEWPGFFLPRMLDAAAGKLSTRLEAIDGNGLLPLRATDGPFTTAYSFRRFLQKTIRDHLDDTPRKEPLAHLDLPSLDRLPSGVAKRWPTATATMLEAGPAALAELPIDHDVPPVEEAGGAEAGRRRLRDFVDRLDRYDEHRNEPEADATSRLSSFLHYGHVGAHEVFDALVGREGWSPNDLGDRRDGRREGFWGMSTPAQAFLDELVTWRELGFVDMFHRRTIDTFDSLPDWARKTLGEHESDAREHVYDLASFDAAETHDPLWNAAQNQLRREGRIHNYLRMLWGKKVLEWTASPRDALDVMIELNDRYAIDGRDPNSTSGIFWVLGRYDRAWGPERPIFGKIRYMTSSNTRRKVRVDGYIDRYDGERAGST